MTPHSRHPRKASPAENLASILYQALRLASGTIRGSAVLVRTVTEGLIWNEGCGHEHHAHCPVCAHYTHCQTTVECCPPTYSHHCCNW